VCLSRIIYRVTDIMIESPVLQQIKAEWIREGTCAGYRKLIVKVLVARFGSGAEVIEARIKRVDDETRPEDLLVLAATCADLEAFATTCRSESVRRASGFADDP
jgi:hypothetical protein